MDLYAPDIMGDLQRAPLFVDLPAIRQELKIPLNDGCQVIRFCDAQTETILVDRSVPELTRVCEV